MRYDSVLGIFVNDEGFGTENDLAVVQQRHDLGSLKRLVAIQGALRTHVDTIANSVASLTIIREALGESTEGLLLGAQPDWYEDEVEATRYLFESLQARLTAMGERLAKEYAA